MTPYDPARHIDAAAPLLGLEIRPEWRAGVSAFLEVAAAMAALVEGAPEDPGPESAAVYRPGEAER